METTFYTFTLSPLLRRIVLYFLVAMGTCGSCPAEEADTVQPSPGIPPNDQFENATDITGRPTYTEHLDFRQATASPGEFPDDEFLNATLWWSWTAPADGTLSANVEGPNTVTTRLYRMIDERLERVSTEGSSHPAKKERTYWLAVGLSPDRDPFQTCLGSQLAVEFHENKGISKTAPVEVNGSAQILTGVMDPRVPAATSSIFHQSGRFGAWVEWTAPQDGLYSFQFTGSDLHLYKDDLFHEVDSLSVRKGEKAVFAVRSHEPGPHALLVETLPGIKNDVYANAIELTNLSGEMEISGRHAGRDLDPLLPSTRNERNHVTTWYRWNASAKGALFFTLNGSGRMRFYEDDPDSGLVEISTNVLPSGRSGQSDLLRVSSDRHYLISVALEPTHSAYASYQFHTESPGSDAFSDAPLLAGSQTAILAIPFDASVEPGEPSVPPGSPRATQWWRWKAPEDGVVRVLPRVDPVFEAFTGTSIGSLSPLKPFDEHSVRQGEILHFRASVGENHTAALEIRFTPALPPEAGTVSPPENDDFANARELEANQGVVCFSTEGATRENNEPSSSEGSLWWTFHSKKAGFFIIDDHIQVYRGDTIGQLVPNPTRFFLQADIPVFLRASQSSETSFSYRFKERPPNDAFVNALDLGCMRNHSSFVYLHSATSEEGDPVPQRQNHGTVWWKWQAPQDGVFTIHLSESSNDVFVYEGESLQELQPLPFSQARIVRRNEHYHIAVRASQLDLEAKRIDLRFKQAPPNDLFHNRIDLGSGSLVAVQKEGGTSALEPEERLDEGNAGTIWFQWRGVGSGGVEFSLDKRELHLYVFRGERLTSLELVGSAPGRSSIVADNQPGQDYILAVLRTSNRPSEFNLTIRDGWFDNLRFDEWVRWRFPDTADHKPGADPDGDGRGQMVEFLQATDPGSYDGFEQKLERKSEKLLMTYRRRIQGNNLRYRYQWSSDLQTWNNTDVTPVEDITRSGLGGENVKAHLFDVPDEPTVFWRVVADLH